MRSRERGRAFWRARRKEVLERAGGRCEGYVPDHHAQRCNGQATDAAHEAPLRSSGTRFDAEDVRNDMTNLRALSRACHEIQEARLREQAALKRWEKT